MRKIWQRLPDRVRRAVGLRSVRLWLSSTRKIAAHNRRLPLNAQTLNFYPMMPQPRAQIVGILDRLDIRIGVDIRLSGPTIAWDTGTVLAPFAQARLPADAINLSCIDISKGRVDCLWADIAGYSITVDPVSMHGPIVVKSEANSLHDGYIANAPLLRRRPGVVYQRFIDARVGDVFVETRPVIMRDRIPVVLESEMPIPHWRAHALITRARAAHDLYSAEEISLLLAFAAQIGLDYGELDVLRETSTGRLFVVDANRTPVRPHFMPDRDIEIEMDLMSESFAEAFRDLLSSKPSKD